MERVVVLGRGGAGETTTAGRLGGLLRAPVVELHRLSWSTDLHVLRSPAQVTRVLDRTGCRTQVQP